MKFFQLEEGILSKILIIGGAGFIGSNLIDYYCNNRSHKVDIIDNFSRGKKDEIFKKLTKNKNVNFLKIDLSKNSFNLKKIKSSYDYIYQLAAILGVENVLNSPENVLKKNYQIQSNSIDIAKKQKKLKKFIFFSTSEVHIGSLKHLKMKFPTKEKFPIALDDLDNPRTSYSLSKIYGEALLYASSLNFMILRPYNIYGPRMGMSHVIPQILKKINKEKKFINIFSPDHTRSFCFIDDAIKQIINLSHNNKLKNSVHNIGNDIGEIKIRNLAKILLKVCKSEHLKLKFLDDKSNSLKRRVPYINKKYQKNLKLTPLDKGCEITYNWYLKNFFND